MYILGTAVLGNDLLEIFVKKLKITISLSLKIFTYLQIVKFVLLLSISKGVKVPS